MATHNYLILCDSLGVHRRGDVVPSYLIDGYHDAEFLIQREMIQKTLAASTSEVVLPKTREADADREVIAAELNDHKKRLAAAEKAAKAHEARADEEKRRADALKAELGKQVPEIDRLNKVIAGQKKDLDGAAKKAADLQADLDAANKLLADLANEREAAGGK